MSLLGFDAIGRFALGQMAASGSNVLVGGAGSYVIGGNGAAFGFRQTVGPTNYAVVANAAAFVPALNAGAGSYNEIGAAVLFSIGAALSGANYALIGNSVKTAMVFNIAVGNYVAIYGEVAGTSALNAGMAAYQVTGGGAAMGRDFVNWWPARSPASNWTGESASSPVWVTSASIPPAWTVDSEQDDPEPVVH